MGNEASPWGSRLGVAYPVPEARGGAFVNQSAAFGGYHVSGADPAGDACLTDAALAANRFRVAMTRHPAAA